MKCIYHSRYTALSKDTMKEGAMCLGYFCVGIPTNWFDSSHTCYVCKPIWRAPTQYHLLLKTYQQAAMHWVTSKDIRLIIRGSGVRISHHVDVISSVGSEHRYPPVRFPLAFQRNRYNRRLCVDLLLSMGHLCRGFDSCPPDYQNKPREVAQLVEQSISVTRFPSVVFYIA